MGEMSDAMTKRWSDLTGLDFKRLGIDADADEIRETSVAQPLLLFGALTGAGSLFMGDDSLISVVAGHSVGEIAAAALSGAIETDDGFRLVTARGAAMSKAAQGSGTGMSAVLGGERDLVLARLAELGLTAANENGAGQIVAAGSLEQLAVLAENPPEGSRVRALQVSGAFHTSVMQPAVKDVQALADGLVVSAPRLKVLSNSDGAVVSTGTEIMNRIVGQIAAPVRWDLCMQTLADLGVTGVIELPPAGTLVGLVKRAQPAIETLALKTPEDLPAAQEFVAKHGIRA